MTPEQNSATIETGRAALARGAWDEAWRAFSACLEEGETPDLLEGLGWAQWWLNDPESSMRNRERAYRLLRQAGDCRGAARVATGLGVDAVDLFGEPIARGWLERARRLLSGFESSAEFGRLAL